MLPDEEPFETWLRRSRRALDLTQMDLAARAHCSAAAIRKLEAGERRPSRQLAELLADALQLPPAQRAVFLRAARPSTSPPALAGSPPGVRAAAAGRHNLITPLTTLVDRTNDIAQLSQLITSPDARLVTVVGPPGIGKTRLSLQCGRQVAEHFPDGVWFVDLAPVEDQRGLMPAIGLALAARSVAPQAAGMHPPETRLAVQQVLQDQALLLILDNFEQLLAAEDSAGAAVEVTALLQGCPEVKALVTSRLPLQVYGEHRYPLPPLSFPPHEAPGPAGYTPEQLMTYEAVQLFVMRLRQHQPGFHLEAGNQAAVVALMWRMEGIPLAIELAAAAVRHTPLDQLAQRLAAPLEAGQPGWLALFHAQERDRPRRQQTLEHMIGWSYHLLDTAHQQVFRRLGVLAGAFDADAAAAICLDPLPDGMASGPDVTPSGPDGEASRPNGAAGRPDQAAGGPSIHAMLDHLAEHYLIARVEAEAGGGQQSGGQTASWRLLEIMRQFALEMLDPAERRQAIERHARYFAARLQQLWQTTPDVEVIAFIRRCYPDFTAALRGCLQRGEKALAMQLAEHLAWWWEYQAFLSEGLALTEQVLNLPGEAAPEQHIEVLLWGANHAWQQHQFPLATRWLEQTLALIGDDPRWRGETLNALGRIFLEQGDYTQAERTLMECFHQTRAHPQFLAEQYPLTQLGEVALGQGDLALARTRLEQAIPSLPDDDIPFMPMAYTDLAEVLLALNEPAAAAEQLRRCRAPAGRHIRRLCCFLSTLAGLLLHQGGWLGHSPRTQTTIEQAASLLGAMDGLGARAGGMHLSQFYRQITEQRIALTRQRLPAGRWQTAWDTGRAWTREQALEKAREVLG